MSALITPRAHLRISESASSFFTKYIKNRTIFSILFKMIENHLDIRTQTMDLFLILKKSSWIRDLHPSCCPDSKKIKKTRGHFVTLLLPASNFLFFFFFITLICRKFPKRSAWSYNCTIIYALYIREWSAATFYLNYRHKFGVCLEDHNF